MLAKGEAVEIVTGAPIPEGADAVVMVEDTEREDEELKFLRAVTVNENVMKKGSDIKKGEMCFKKGQVLGSSEIGVLAALGLTKVKVLKIPNGRRFIYRRRSHRTRKPCLQEKSMTSTLTA